MKKLLKNYSNTIAYCILFGAALSVPMGPLGAGMGIAIGVAIGQQKDKKSVKNK
ncbi:hypothetical protein ACSAXG_11925 (plasmid) [Staphylococcus chromogenes]